MQLNTRENFATLFNDKNYKISAEIGVRRGCFSHYLLSNMNPHTHYAIDPWDTAPCEGSSNWDEQQARTRLAIFPNCVIIKKTSENAAATFLDDSFDFVYIDACHTYEYVKKDIELWWPKIKTGGILAGHDFHEGDWPGIVKAVKEFAESNNLEIHTTGIGSSYGDDGGDGNKQSWWFEKNV